jgi:hypothetical protein
VWMNFINFMPFIILIILIFSNLAALAFDQWCICDDFGTSTNQFCCDQCFVGFFLKVHQGFFPFNLCKKLHFFWHHILNQHIHIDIMHPSSITHFNTMIIIPLCENCELCTYWCHMKWIFIFLPQYQSNTGYDLNLQHSYKARELKG